MSELFTKLGIDWRLLVANTITFFVMLWILRRFAYRPILRLLEQRQKTVADSLTKAKAVDEQWKELQTQKQRIIEETKTESLRHLKAAEAEAQAVRQDLVAKAEAEAAAMLARNKLELERQKDDMLVSAKAEIVDLVLTASGKVLETELTTDKQRALAEATVATLKQA
ncbi:MAG: F0F1 ATP synthase subunit B [Candidatus Kerfeldbacteria bacterium]|nr:F0F1 ATP synthase subunit B [Candidatus Kerfeldbacteria bacterium]